MLQFVLCKIKLTNEICIFRSNQGSFFNNDNGFLYANFPMGVYLLIVSNSINFSQNNNCSIVDGY